MSAGNSIGAIIQARMGSTRLPGKILMDLAGKPMLARIVERAGKSRRVDKIIVATSDRPADDPVAELAGKEGWLLSRGSEDDVLDRYYQAAREYGLGIVVRLTGDNPLVDAGVIDQVLDELLADDALDYVSGGLVPGAFPLGVSVEGMRFGALHKAWSEDRDLATREHVTAYIYRNRDLFNIKPVTSGEDYSAMRWTVDTIEDMEFVRKIYGYFGDRPFSWKDVVRLLRTHPEWGDINRHVEQREV